MSEIKFEKKEKPEDLIQAEKLIDDGKFEEALSLLKNFEEKGEVVLSHLIKCDLLLQYGF